MKDFVLKTNCSRRVIPAQQLPGPRADIHGLLVSDLALQIAIQHTLTVRLERRWHHDLSGARAAMRGHSRASQQKRPGAGALSRGPRRSWSRGVDLAIGSVIALASTNKINNLCKVRKVQSQQLWRGPRHRARAWPGSYRQAWHVRWHFPKVGLSRRISNVNPGAHHWNPRPSSEGGDPARSAGDCWCTRPQGERDYSAPSGTQRRPKLPQEEVTEEKIRAQENPRPRKSG